MVAEDNNALIKAVSVNVEPSGQACSQRPRPMSASGTSSAMMGGGAAGMAGGGAGRPAPAGGPVPPPPPLLPQLRSRKQKQRRMGRV